MLKGAVGAATLGDRREAEQYLTEAARSAELLGDRNDYCSPLVRPTSPSIVSGFRWRWTIRVALLSQDDFKVFDLGVKSVT